MWQPLIEAAIAQSLFRHRGQKDKGGKPYIFHCLRVMLAMETEEQMIVALLHDVLEDTDCKPDELIALFDVEVASAVVALTRLRSQDYEAYIGRVAQHPLARAVKIADLRDNLDRSRISNPTERDQERWRKYERALTYLLTYDGTATPCPGPLSLSVP